MKLFTGSLAAALVLVAAGAQAQVRGPYTAASDFYAPYAMAPRPAPGPQYVPGPYYGPGPQYGYGLGPALLPSTEVYSVLRDNGFSPLGIPRLRGFVYRIAAIDRGGESGRLVIDARNGRIIRFMPANRMGDHFYEEQSAIRGVPGVPPPAEVTGQVGGDGDGAPRLAAPKVASRTAVPVPKAKPVAAKPASEPVQQAATPSPKPAEVQAAAPQAAVTTGSVPAKPVPPIAPTQDMPKAQGLE